jgi:penicillin-binding protein 1A
VISQQVARDMNMMMNKVVEEGTAKRAMLDGIRVAGKTGTTNAYRDAWFVGFTGNYICGVWFGNDDYASTNRMTGGALPAMTWHDIMAYAHQGIELKQIPGVPPPVSKPSRQNVAAKPDVPQRPSLLTKRGADVLVHVEQLMDDATRALAARDGAAKRADGGQDAEQPQRPDTFAATYDPHSAATISGN